MQVDWDDDEHDRWILWWHRFDPDRRERRNTVVAAFTEEVEFHRCFLDMSAELDRLKALGEAEDVERLSGVIHPAGYRAMMRAERAGRVPDLYLRGRPRDNE